MAKQGRETDWTDGHGGTRVPTTDWESVRTHLEEFCEGGEFSVEDGRAVCEFPNASLAVTRDGTVETGMPLHAFERTDVDAVLFDHERGEFVVEDDDGLRYSFRRP